jgi:hypothetical protein
MLEKIIREMVTKDGQERLLASLSKLVDQATGETAKKVTELVEFIKEGSQNPALISKAPAGSASFQPSPGTGPLTRASRDLNNPNFPVPQGSEGVTYTSPKAADFVSDQMLNLLRKIKDSVAETGGLVAEDKSLTRDLRGEVLGMGRDLARKLDELANTQAGQPRPQSGREHEDVVAIIQESISELKQQIDNVMRDKRRQSNSSTMTRTTIDNQEVSEVVKHVLTECGLNQLSAQIASPLDKEAILSAVREAYEAYRPEIELQQFGLERDEILQCLREGLEDYRGSGGISREEVISTIHDTLQHTNLPPPINEAREIRDEVLGAVKECLEEFRPSFVPLPSQSEGITREDIFNALSEVLSSHDLTGPREIEINREDLMEAVKAGLQSAQPTELPCDRVLDQLQTLVDDMHAEFKAYSSANGRDTEQVLDALKDGLESLRAEIETYVDKAQDVTHKDEIVDTMRAELERLRTDVQGFVAEGPRGDQAFSRGDMISYIKSEFEHLHEQLSSQFLPAAKDKEEIINAINSGFEGMKTQVATRSADIDSNEEINEAMKEEFEQLKDVVLGGYAHHKTEILEQFQTSLDELHNRLGESMVVPGSNDVVLAAVKEEFEHLRETLATSLVRSGGGADKDEIIDSVRDLIDGLHTHVTTTQGESTKEGLNSIQGELEHLRESLSSILVRGSDTIDKEEILETLRAGLEEIRTNSKTMGISEELIEAFRGELEQVRQSNGMTRQHSRADTEEVLETVRLGLDDLRSHLEKKIENPERQITATGEILDALNDGLNDLRSDVARMVDKPVDMTVSYEILDTLKDGIASLRLDIDRLKGRNDSDEEQPVLTGNEVVLAEDPEKAASRDLAPDSIRRNDFEKMEVMLSQLQVKVESIDTNIQHSAPTSEPSVTPSGSAVKDDLVGIEDLLKDLQATVSILEERERTSLEGVATKDDTDAIETLLGNVKAKVEDMVLLLPDPEAAVTKENFEQVEATVRTANDAIEALSAKIDENGATKGDVAVVEVLVQDMKTALDELKAAKSEEDEVEKITKIDIDTLALLVAEVKAKVDEMKIPAAEDLPSFADVEQLTGLIHDFRDKYDAFIAKYEDDIRLTAVIQDDRRRDSASLAEQVTEVSAALTEIKDGIKVNFVEGIKGADDIKETLKYIEDSLGSKVALNADVKELMETVTREFERAQGSLEDLRVDQDDKSAMTLEKHDVVKEAIITGLCEKIDDRFNVLMAKYDDAQLLADEQTRIMKEKTAEQEQALADTKVMAEELRVTIDTLGASITGMDGRFEETTQKLSADSESVFGRFDQTIAKLDEHHGDTKTEHQHTRDEVANALRALNALQDNVTEYHPKFMVTLREILALVNQHYEHSQKAKDLAEQQVRAIAEDTRARAEEIQSHFTNLPALLPPPPAPVEPVEKYDDSKVQEKLDKLLHHADDGEMSSAQLQRLDEIHKQVMNTAAEVSEFVAKQTQLITDGHESKEREAEEVALLVERRLAQKEDLETDIQGLKEEKDSLLAIVAALQAERENLANQKVRLTGEVSSLHTALDIRREELHAMDAKADALERRILNGIMDHSRALMMAKGKTSPTKPKKRANADASIDAKLMPPPSAAANGLSMALKPRPAIRRNGPPPNPASRRILSLSQITNNVPTGAQAYSGGAANLSSGATGLKRSHSVKTNYLRKTSWAGRPNTAEVNKENETLSEESETELEHHQEPGNEHDQESEHGHDDDESETGTQRRHSYGTESYAGRSSYGGSGSEYTYASGSYMTGSDVDRRTASYGSTRSLLEGGQDTIDEDVEDSQSEASNHEDTVTVPAVSPADHAAPEEIRALEPAPVEEATKKEIHIYTAPTDSALGTDLSSAAIERHHDADYFRRAAEEESTVG